MANRTSSHARIRAALAACRDPHLSSLAACTIRHGWGYSGPGPARYGWQAVYVSGRTQFLGATVAEVESRCADALDLPHRLWVSIRRPVYHG